MVSSQGRGCGLPPTRVDANGGRRIGTPPYAVNTTTFYSHSSSSFDRPLFLELGGPTSRVLPAVSCGISRYPASPINRVTPPLTRSSPHASYGATFTCLHSTGARTQNPLPLACRVLLESSWLGRALHKLYIAMVGTGWRYRSRVSRAWRMRSRPCPGYPLSIRRSGLRD